MLQLVPYKLAKSPALGWDFLCSQFGTPRGPPRPSQIQRMSPARDPRTGRFILTHENTEELSADPSAASSEDPVAIALPGEFLEEDSEPEEGRSPREDPVEVLRPEEDPGRQL
ncbi:uncharacterized protein ATNIH1004_007219 [Aspergillus tanneri]|uniref:Uncharacterized protein n=1 Tax=Aspergillus tanneri TaxID=1220188 RepID=A0A5M9MMW4_9EURO|nr:uncharacterized protein ATNIH1004_007219 [Aspergillus tanneri]KAA8645799.1 hypothetical protein ATNIH1004_007219 [Aspergillus tanneri]